MVVLLSSCKKFTDIDPPKNAISTEQVFADDQSANSAVLGIYTTLNSQGFGYGNVTLFAGLSSDELLTLSSDNGALDLMNNSLLASNEQVAGIWAEAFKVIGQANACIEGLNLPNGVTAGKKTELLAEARFLRAFSYFYLVNLYGDLPLVRTTAWPVIRSQNRTNVVDVNQFILDDLKAAYEGLPLSHSSGTKARSTKWAAAAMIARFQLYMGNWSEASSYASEVLDKSGLFNGELPPLVEVFLTGSTEAIWQMPPLSYWVNTYEGTAFNNFGSLQYVLSDRLATEFKPDDLRTRSWLDIINSQGNTYFVPAKYKANTYSGDAKEQYVMLRLAEQLLVRAEAEVRSDNPEKAIADLNVIRRRAGLTELPNDLSKNEVIAAVEKENQLEFFAEWGHRWLDLKRTTALSGSGKRADEVMPVAKPGKWQATDALYPVPQKEISLNPALAPNNSGY